MSNELWASLGNICAQETLSNEVWPSLGNKLIKSNFREKINRWPGSWHLWSYEDPLNLGSQIDTIQPHLFPFLLTFIWPDFMRNDIDKKKCHFFLVIKSSLLTSILHEIPRDFLLIVKLEFLIDYIKKNSTDGVHKNRKWPQLLKHFFLLTKNMSLFHGGEKRSLHEIPWEFLQIVKLESSIIWNIDMKMLKK